MNKYIVNLPNPVVATNDANLVTGITGARWVGAKPDEDGIANNFAAGNGLIYSNAIVSNKTDTALSKIVTLEMPTLTAATNNAVQVDLASLEFSSGITILGIIGIGIVDKNAGAILVASPDVLGSLNYSIVRNSMIIFVPQTQIGNLQNKSLNVMIYYR